MMATSSIQRNAPSAIRDSGRNILAVDLQLPKDKLPTNPKDASLHYPMDFEDLVPNYAIGGCATSEKDFYYNEYGLFGSVLTAWKNHWTLRTSPEDWWFPVACYIAKAIDKDADKEDVRKFFVNHEGKKNLCVDVDVYTIDQVSYDSFFEQMTRQIQDNINVPGYTSLVKSDFSTSTLTHQISSQINLMASMQKYFSYEMGLCGCGLKGLEMLGNQADWDALLAKVKKVRQVLKPIQKSIWLWDDWWDHVEMVFQKLSESHRNPNSQEVANFWANILMENPDWKYGPSGMKRHAAESYNGWLIQFLLGRNSILKEDLDETKTQEKLSGVNSVPMTITCKYKDPPIQDKAKLTAGMQGFHLFQDVPEDTPCIRPNHFWALALPLDSPLRAKHH